jgi:hypothetical protein
LVIFMNKPICDGRIENPALRADMTGDAGQHGVVRSQHPVPGRTPEDDLRVCYHEQSHATVSRLTTGRPLGGVTAQPGEDFSGLCWGPAYQSKFDDTDTVSLLATMVPTLGENLADLYLHCFHRITELVAGTEGERLFCDGEPWFAAHDERQAIAYASLITSSPVSAAAFIEFARVEAISLLTASAHIVHALASELQIVRTMDGAAIDLCIERAVAAKAAVDKMERRERWTDVENNAARFVADWKADVSRHRAPCVIMASGIGGKADMAKSGRKVAV